MSRYMDADALKKQMLDYFSPPEAFDVADLRPSWAIQDGIEDIFETFPTADVAPVVHGEWLKKGKTLYMCSKCGRVIDAYSDLSKTVEKFPYCHCGAKMFIWKTTGEVKDEQNMGGKHKQES